MKVEIIQTSYMATSEKASWTKLWHAVFTGADDWLVYADNT